MAWSPDEDERERDRELERERMLERRGRGEGEENGEVENETDWKRGNEIQPSLPTLQGAWKNDPSFTGFDDVEQAEVDLVEKTQGTKTHWWQRISAVSFVSHIFSQMSLANVWRFPTIALAMSIDWNLEEVGLLDFLIPYVIVLVCVAWPILVAEIGFSQTTGGSGPKAFGSICVQARSAGLSFLISVGICMFMPVFAAYSAIFMFESSQHKAAYHTSRAVETISAHRVCVHYGNYIPDIQPQLCQDLGNRFDVSCFEENNCQLWAGTGRCMAVPWGPAAGYILSNADNVDPLLDNDYPQYCAARQLHDIATGSSQAVMSRAAYWRDYGKNFNWRVALAVVAIWGSVLIMNFVDHSFVDLFRCVVAAVGVATFVLALIACSLWFDKNKWMEVGWMKGMVRLHPHKLLTPEVWANAVVQSCFSLGLLSNQIQVVSAKATNNKQNIVWTASFVLAINVIISYCALWVVYLAYAAATSQDVAIKGDDAMSATIKYDLRNMPFGQLYTSFASAFDNSSQLDGTSPRSWVIGVLCWLSLLLIGINGLSIALEAVVEPLYASALNWKLNLSRWLYVIITTAFFIAFSVILWFGVGWGFAVILQHFFLNVALPFVLLYEALAVGWVYGWESRVRHYGRRAFWLQISLYFTGVLVLTFMTARLFNSPTVYLRYLGFVVGVIFIAASFTLPVLFHRTHDKYGRKHTTQEKLKLTALGYCDHLRQELNHICCHTSRFMRLSVVWTLLIRYVAPVAAFFALAVVFTNPEQTVAFSPYRPFYNIQFDIFAYVERALLRFDLLRAPPAFIAVAFAFALCIALAIIVLFFLPEQLAWLPPQDTNPNFFNVNRATELFAASPAQLQIPTRLNPHHTDKMLHAHSLSDTDTDTHTDIDADAEGEGDTRSQRSRADFSPLQSNQHIAVPHTNAQSNEGLPLHAPPATPDAEAQALLSAGSPFTQDGGRR